MTVHDKTLPYLMQKFQSNEKSGLKLTALNVNRQKYGVNVLTEKKGDSIFVRILNVIKEPMLLILLFGFLIALGTNVGKFLKSGEADFLECFGILFAIILSVLITLFMEGSSQKAFKALNKIYDSASVKVIRDGVVVFIRQVDVVVGDIILIESGDKIVADGRIIECEQLRVDESALTGESVAVQKTAQVINKQNVTLAERYNCVFSGTFVTGGSGKMLVTATGDSTEIGKIAGELTGKVLGPSPLQQKLNKLGKIISLIGIITAVFVFTISAVKLYLLGGMSFSGIQDLFLSCIILIVAAVPEGLPTIVAVSLALNMIKLAKENALIKKMNATETTGAVSVICSDKTGTITENKMTVEGIYENGQNLLLKNNLSEQIKQNIVCNSTANMEMQKRKKLMRGNATECALLEAYIKYGKKDFLEYREGFFVVERQPFSSQLKFMTTTIKVKDTKRTLLKGAPEIVLNKCELSIEKRQRILAEMEKFQIEAKRVICFAHLDQNEKNGGYIYDGFAVIEDPIRKDVYRAVLDAKRAGIKIKILTGDNKVTAFAIAKKLKIVTSETQVFSGEDIDNMDEEKLKSSLDKIVVVARSTPMTKLRIVRALKSKGEVVAVTGDGINDAPAIKHADVGIAMGISGSEITKETADVILLDDSFATVMKAVSFGRNVYKNLQRFILFQLTVNLSALLFITVCAVMGLESPFNTFQLLWINVIMDGPPALTLGLERASDSLMDLKPIKRNQSIVGLKMLLRILITGAFIGVIMVVQYLFNFLKVPFNQTKSALFTLFITFQLFNAFNCRELGLQSIFSAIGKNKIMAWTFLLVFVLHVFIVQVGYSLFGILPMNLLTWIKTIALAFSVLLFSELGKCMVRLLYRRAKKR
ncbi:MAG: calcium-translocating P-type ATPase, PMCA-type [Clostridia bacterium]|nr:calcium-translocating P-type ATPase, PMCA-type [Clostridia bacterium]